VDGEPHSIATIISQTHLQLSQLRPVLESLEAEEMMEKMEFQGAVPMYRKMKSSLTQTTEMQ
jgi:hypothetical protein